MSREFLTEFIKMYENLPCLWDLHSKEYRDRNKKDAAYAKLIAKLKEIDRNATKDSVIKKINNIRSTFRKEKKKIRESIRSGATGDSIYEPKLWYYSLLAFLCDQTKRRRTFKSEIESEDEEEEGSAFDENTCDETNIQSEENEPLHTEVEIERNLDRYTNPTPSQSHSAKKMKFNTQNDERVLTKSMFSMGKSTDEFQLFADYIASEFRLLKHEETKMLLRRKIQRAIVEVADLDSEDQYQMCDVQML